MYPEVGETDFIEEWRESETFAQHIGIRHDFPRNISSDILIVCLRVFLFIDFLHLEFSLQFLTPVFLLTVLVR